MEICVISRRCNSNDVEPRSATDGDTLCRLREKASTSFRGGFKKTQGVRLCRIVRRSRRTLQSVVNVARGEKVSFSLSFSLECLDEALNRERAG